MVWLASSQIADQQLSHAIVAELEPVDQFGRGPLRHASGRTQRRRRARRELADLAQDTPGGVADVGRVVGAPETTDTCLVCVVQKRPRCQVREGDALRRQRCAYVEQRMLLVAPRHRDVRHRPEKRIQLRIVLRRAEHLLVADETVGAQCQQRRRDYP